MGPWLVDLAEGLSQALATPGASAVLRLFAITLRPDETGAIFVVVDRELRLAGAFPGDAPFREASVQALAREALAEGPARPVVAEAAPGPDWPAGLAVGLPDQRGALVVLGRRQAISEETRDRIPLLLAVLTGLVEVDRARQAARRAEGRFGRLRELIQLDADARDLPGLGRGILKIAGELVDAELGGLWLRARGVRGRLELAASSPAPAGTGPAGALAARDVERLVGAFPLVCPPHPLGRPRQILGAPDLGSALLVPVERGGTLLGLLAAGRRRGAAPFQETHAELLTGLAQLAAIPLANAALRTRLAERVGQLRAVRRIGRAVEAGSTVEELLRVTTRELRRILEFDLAALVVRPEAGADGLVLIGELGRVPRLLDWTARIARAGAPAAPRSRRAVAIRDLAATTAPVPPFVREYPDARALLSCPLAGSGRAGALVLVSRVPGRFGRREACLVEPIAAALALGLPRGRPLRAPAAAPAEASPPARRLARAAREPGIGRLAAALAHQLRNPLTVIGTTIQYLRDRQLVAEDHRPLLDAADMKARDMSEAIEGMLDLVRPLELRPEAAAVEPLLAEVAEFVRGRAAERAVEVRVDAGSGAPAAVMDRRYLGQALLQLAVHALESMPEGGRLVLSARPAPDGERVALSVADTGPAIAAAELGAVFEPFDTASRGSRRIQLALTRRIVEAHGGDIEATSESGRGTTFTVTLPVVA